jgi:Uma2 family endonuclease
MSAATLAQPISKPMPRVWSVAERERLVELGLIADATEPDLRFTVPQSVELASHGFFDHERIQLIHGEVFTMTKANEPHSCSILLTQSTLQSVFGIGFTVRVQMPLVFNLDTDPEPDIAVVRGSPRDYQTWPTTALLIVEVSDSSFTFDVTEKAELYATAGVPDYWVIDLANRRLLVLRDPAPLPDGGSAYRTQLIRYSNDTISPLEKPSATVSISDLLP